MLDPLYDMIMDVKSKCATIDTIDVNICPVIDTIDVNICPVIFGVTIFSILMGHTRYTQKTDGTQMEHR